MGEAGAMRYGEPLTKFVVSGRVERVFQQSGECDAQDNAYAFKVERSFRGEVGFSDLIIPAPYSRGLAKKGDQLILFLMDVDNVVPDYLTKCYPGTFEGAKIGYLDYASTDGAYKVDKKRHAVYSLYCDKDPHITVADRVFDGEAYSFVAESKDAGRNCRDKCVEIKGSYNDLMLLVLNEFGSISLKESPAPQVAPTKGL
jgi:hypothetical protein